MIKEYLKNAALRSKWSHAYIIEGETSELRREAAGEFISALMNKDEHSKAQTEAGTHPDVIWVEHEKPLTISVREVREQVCDTMGIRPFAGGWKLYIMDDAELMPPGAQNALLKTVEEPPEYGCIILMTKNREMLLDTIRSRCICLKCDKKDNGYEYTGPDLSEYISFDVSSGREHMDATDAADIASAVLAGGADEAGKFMDYIRGWIHDQMVNRSGSSAFDMTRAYRALELTDKAEKRLKFNVNSELTIEMMLMEI